MLSFKFIRRAAGITGILLFLTASDVTAAPPSAIDEAEELMRRGNQLRRAGDDEGALPIFKRAYELYKSPRTSAQLGLVEWALGRWVDADEHLTDALKAVNTDVFIRNNRTTIEDSLKVAKRNVGRVEITGDPTGAEVLVNGRVVGRVPLTQPVKVIAGSVDIELRAPGYRAGFRTIAVAGLQYQPVVIRLEKEGEARSAGPSGGPGPVQRPGGVAGSVAGYESDLVAGAGMAPWRKIMIGVAAGASGVALGVAGYGVWRHNDQVDAFNRRKCLETANGAILASTRATDTRCAQFKTGFETARTMTIVGFSAAGALGVTALVLYLTGGDGGLASAPAPRRLACAPDLARPGLLCALPF
jgi:hypothetical protein